MKMRSEGLTGFWDLNGVIVVNPIYKQAGNFMNHMAPVETTDGKFNFINPFGKTITDEFSLDTGKYEFDVINSKGDGIIAKDKATSLYGLYKVGGGFVIPAEYITLIIQSNGQIVATSNKGYTLFSSDGTELASGYYGITACGTGTYVAIDKSQKITMMNEFGEEVYDFCYFRYPNNVHWDGDKTFFYYNTIETIITVDSSGRELAWITSPYNSGLAEFDFVNGFIQMIVQKSIFYAEGNRIGHEWHCDFFKPTGEKINLE